MTKMPETQTHAEERAPLAVAVGVTVNRLQNDYLSGGGRAPAARGVLAALRRGAGRPALSDPLALERVLGVMDPVLTENEVGTQDRPSPSEEAAYQALAFFALHMQSATAPVHVRGTSFATACGLLAARSESKSMKPRFDALLLARNPHSRLTHVRSLITLLRGQQIGCDYGAFARDLRALMNPRHRDGVLLRWGRDFALAPYRKNRRAENHPTA